MDKLQGMRVFCKVVELGGMAKAARALDMSPATVTEIVARLEASLEARLLHRTTRRIATTEAGQLWYAYARRILDETQEAEAAVRDLAMTPGGNLRVTLTEGFAEIIVYPHLEMFARQYPRIELDLQVTDRIVDLVESGLDLALRAGYLNDSSLVAKPLLTYQRWTCASPGYLHQHGMPDRPGDLGEHACLTYRGDAPSEHWDFWRDSAVHRVAVCGPYRSNMPSALLNWARAGLGVVQLPDWYVSKDVREGHLVRILEPFTITRPALLPAIYAVTPSARIRPAKTEAFLGFLAERISSLRNTQVAAATVSNAGIKARRGRSRS